MRFSVVTMFGRFFDGFTNTSLVGRAIEKGSIALDLIDPRDFVHDRHRTVDDTPYGGGHGMVLKVEPLVAALESIESSPRPRRILLSPQGRPLTQDHLARLRRFEHLALVCGRYEGFDDRIRSFIDEELSLGDFVLTGGETAAIALIDGVSRLCPGVLGNEASTVDESHSAGLLEYPQYTRPRDYRGLAVPEVLLSGDHARISAWRTEQRLLRTRQRRPDLLANAQVPTPAAMSGNAGRTYLGLLHHPVYDRQRQTVTTSITNLDLHDIARSARTYGLAGYYVITPLESQQQLAQQIVEHWHSGHGSRYHQDRAEALALIRIAESLEQTVAELTEKHDANPYIIATTAVSRPDQQSLEALAEASTDRPILLLFGTGWGLAESVLQRANACLAPISGPTSYRHLSVRAAAAIFLDRLFGLRQ